MECKKPMTPNQRENGNKLYKFMYGKQTITKGQMLAFLGWDNKKDRQLRDLISQIAKVVPVVSTSDSKGYKIATTLQDYEEVVHEYNELRSRINELNKRLEPLRRFKNKCEVIKNDFDK